jgi:hypothetical protein
MQLFPARQRDPIDLPDLPAFMGMVRAHKQALRLQAQSFGMERSEEIADCGARRGA